MNHKYSRKQQGSSKSKTSRTESQNYIPDIPNTKYNVKPEKTPSEQDLETLLKEPLFQSSIKRRDELQSTLNKLLRANREISRSINRIAAEKDRFQFDLTNLEVKKFSLIKKSDCPECDAKITELEEQIEDLKQKSKLEIENLESQKKSTIHTVKCLLKQLARLKHIFQKEHKTMIQKLNVFKMKLKPSSVPMVLAAIKNIEDSYHKEIENFEEYNFKFSYFINAKPEDADDADYECRCSQLSSTPSVSSSSSTSGDEAASADFDPCSFLEKFKQNDVDVKYIRDFLEVPLVKALGAITIYQPTDPIYFLAHYLLNYRHNENMYTRKELELEKLMNARKKVCEVKPQPKCDTCVNELFFNSKLVQKKC